MKTPALKVAAPRAMSREGREGGDLGCGVGETRL